MAITETMIANKCNMLLNNGVSPSTGAVQTVTVSLGTLAATGWDAAKAYAVASAIEACLSKTIYSVQHVQTNTLEDDS